MLATADGKVLRTLMASPPGSRCYSGSLDCCGQNKSNYVQLLHDDGLTSLYLHLNSISVKTGERVRQGQVIGRSGSTGCSTGPHLHFQIGTNCGSYWCPTVRPKFDDWTGALSYCTYVLSGNTGSSSPPRPTPPPPFCAEPKIGLYCKSADEIVRCQNGQQVSSEKCKCLVQPQGVPDKCAPNPVSGFFFIQFYFARGTFRRLFYFLRQNRLADSSSNNANSSTNANCDANDHNATNGCYYNNDGGDYGSARGQS